MIQEGGVSRETAQGLVQAAAQIRNLKNRGLDEGVSTRLLIYAALLIGSGVDLKDAVKAAMIKPLTDDPVMQRGMEEIIGTVLPAF